MISYWTDYSAPDAKIVDAVPIRKRFLQLAFSGERLSADPTFRVRYSINRGSDGTLVAAGSDSSGQSFGRRSTYGIRPTSSRPTSARR